MLVYKSMEKNDEESRRTRLTIGSSAQQLSLVGLLVSVFVNIIVQ